MNIVIEKGKQSDIEHISQLYDDLNDFLESGLNYPGWMKGIYPTREDAVNGVEKGTLYVARAEDKIAGSIVLSHEPELAFRKVKWNIDADYSSVFVIYTLAVHPAYLGKGAGTEILKFAIKHCINEHAKAIRLDVYEKNIPAIKLYEKFGFKYVDTVDLGLGKHGLDFFKLYEKLL